MKSRSMLIAVFTAGSALVLAADGLDLKTGLWEMTYVTDVRGSFMPKAVLDKLSPEQRAKVAAAAQKQAAQGPQTMTEKTCLTAADLKAGAFRADDDKSDPSCKVTITEQSKTLQQASVACAGDEPRTSQIRVEALGRDRVKGTINSGGAGGKLSMQLSGKWLNASCAGADDE